MTQYSNPIIVTPENRVHPLTRVPLGGSHPDRKDEKYIQDLLFSCPDALPAAEIDPAYKTLIPVCREMRTAAGPLDLLYVTPDGGIAVVETKLWRNPEARREVIAQILDYAKELASWDYEDLCREIAKATKGEIKSLIDVVQSAGHLVDEARFIDAVARNLAWGRFLLIIAGDGIREGVENLTGFLDRLGRLEFTFGLVELALYRLPAGDLLVQPRVLARTMIVRRSVVRLDGGSAIIEEEGEVQEGNEPAVSADGEFYQRFWSGFISGDLRLDDKTQPLAAPTRSKNIYFPLPPSSSQAWISAYLAPSANKAGVYLRLAKGPFGEAAFKLLLAEQEAINSELGLPVQWLEDKEGRRWVSFNQPLPDLHDETILKGTRSFFADAINRFVNVFRPRMERISSNI